MWKSSLRCSGGEVIEGVICEYVICVTMKLNIKFSKDISKWKKLNHKKERPKDMTLWDTGTNGKLMRKIILIEQTFHRQCFVKLFLGYLSILFD